MSVFHVYCDESGKLHDKDFVVFGAIVIPDEDVAGFDRKWNEYLQDFGVQFLHCNDAFRFDGPFKKHRGRESDRNNLLRALAALIMDRSCYVQAVPMDAKTFRSHPDRAKLKNPVYAGFESLLLDIVMSSRKGHQRDHEFHIVYDLAEEYSVEVLKLFNTLRQRTEYRHRFPALSFADDEKFPLLQAADLLAYCRFQECKSNVSAIVADLLNLFTSIRKEESSAFYRAGSGLGTAFRSQG